MTVTQWIQLARKVGMYLQPGWNDYVGSLSSGAKGATNPPAFNEIRTGVWGNNFDVGDEMWITIHVEHDYKPGSDMYPHVHWVTNDASPAGSAVWKIDWTVAKRNDVTPEAFPAVSSVTLVHPMTTQYGHVVTEVGDGDVIPGAQLEVDSMIILRIERLTDVGQTETGGDAKALFGLQLDLHYQKCYFATPNKAPDFYG